VFFEQCGEGVTSADPGTTVSVNEN
jgi:hypothetical protein